MPAPEKLREPGALPGWLATTTQRECLRVLRARGKYEVFGADPDSGGLNRAVDVPVIDATEIEEEILQAERNALLRAALAELPESHQRLLTLLLRDPSLSYAEIGDILDMPPGSIGPARQRCLRRLSRSPLLAGLPDLAPPAAGAGPGTTGAGTAGGRAARAGPRAEASRTGLSQTGLSGTGAGTARVPSQGRRST